MHRRIPLPLALHLPRLAQCFVAVECGSYCVLHTIISGVSHRHHTMSRKCSVERVAELNEVSILIERSVNEGSCNDHALSAFIGSREPEFDWIHGDRNHCSQNGRDGAGIHQNRTIRTAMRFVRRQYPSFIPIAADSIQTSGGFSAEGSIIMSAQHPRPNSDSLADRLGLTRTISGWSAVGLAVISLVLGASLGYSAAISQSQETATTLARTQDDLKALALAHDTLNERNWILYLEAERLRSAKEISAKPTEPGVFTNGTFAVGTDIEPGTYRGEVAGEFGYWARLNSSTGMLSGIITNAIVRGPFVLTINPGDTAVELRGVTLVAE